MKQCKICNLLKDESEFGMRKYKKTGNSYSMSYCKKCRSVYNSAYSKRSKQASYEQVKIRNEKKKQKLIDYLKSHPCVKCGEADPVVLEFNHINPNEKEWNISQMVKTNWSWDSIMREISKCEVLCANCHRRHTANQQKWFKNQIPE